MPVIYQEQGTLKLGDTVTVQLAEGVKKDFVVTSFLRDAQMNPSLVTSKRMVVHPDDFSVVNQHLNNPEYFIEFKLAKGADRGAFQHAYRDAHLPNRASCGFHHLPPHECPEYSAGSSTGYRDC